LDFSEPGKAAEHDKKKKKHTAAAHDTKKKAKKNDLQFHLSYLTQTALGFLLTLSFGYRAPTPPLIPSENLLSPKNLI